MLARIAVFLIAVALMFDAQPVVAGTTGGLSGSIIDSSSGAPIAAAVVIAQSPSQTSTTKSDDRGFFSFASLAPDTYVVRVSREGFDAQSASGIAVFADQVNILSVRLAKIKQIAVVASRRGVVEPGATSNRTSFDPAALSATQAAGGPGGSVQTYGAMTTTPGVYVPQGQTGWYQAVYIRGGDQDQVGYEFDGIPVARRDWQNSPIVDFSKLGVGELQVYTGGIPATSEATGISGYINQVVKRGSGPGYINVETAVGYPDFSHTLQIEAGGAAPNFSYYVGTLAADSTYRYVNQNNGAGLSKSFFYPVQLQAPGNTQTFFDSGQEAWNGAPGFVAAPGNVYGIATTWDRESIANLHFTLPHRNGSNDDLQLLYMTSLMANDFYSALDDYGGPWPAVNGGAGLSWQDGESYTGPVFAPAELGKTQTYSFPSSPQHAYLGSLPNDARDYWTTSAAIEKIQYQHNLSASTYVRLLAYSTYSDWLLNAPASLNFTYGLEAADWEPATHTDGTILNFASQLSSKQFLTLSASYEQTRTHGWSSVGLFGEPSTPISNLMDAQWNCYNATTGYRDSCYAPAVQGTIANPIPVNLAQACAPGGALNGRPACTANAQYIVTETGANHQYYDVTPHFTGFGLTDEWRPNDRLTVDAGLRAERFSYDLGDTSIDYPARAFWFQTYDNEYCFGPGLTVPVLHGFTPTGTPLPCPSGTSPADISDSGAQQYTAEAFEPRGGFAWTLDPSDVIRGSYGVYARPPATSWMQYNSQQQNLASFIGSSFLYYGFTQPDHLLHPDTSYNTDLSWEHEFKRSGIAFKVSPFLRSTADQDQLFEYDAVLGLTSGLNVGHQVSSGVELSIEKGSFDRDRLAWRLTYTHTRSLIRYSNFPSGNSVIDLINTYVKQYNAYTSACAGTPKNPSICGSTGAGLSTLPTSPQSALPAAPCYANVSGVETADPLCSLPNTVANPYWNNAPAPLFGRNNWYTAYDIFPAPFVGDNGYEVPDTATLTAQYRLKRWTFMPSILFSSGASYGNPLTWPGYDPASCQPIAGTSTADPTTCTRAIFIPRAGDAFDTIGEFKQPWRLTGNVAVGYTLSSHVRMTLSLMHIVDSCHQRGYPWDAPYVCAYSQLPSNVLPPVGNFATPANPGPSDLKYPYAAWNSNLNTDFLGTSIPFQGALTLDVSL